MKLAICAVVYYTYTIAYLLGLWWGWKLIIRVSCTSLVEIRPWWMFALPEGRRGMSESVGTWDFIFIWEDVGVCTCVDLFYSQIFLLGRAQLRYLTSAPESTHTGSLNRAGGSPSKWLPHVGHGVVSVLIFILLKYSLHSIKFTNLKCTLKWFFVNLSSTTIPAIQF